MITKDMPIIEAVKIVNDYVDKAEEFYIIYREVVQSLNKASVFIRNEKTKKLVLKEIEAYDHDDQEFRSQYPSLVFSFIYYIFNHPDKESLFVSEILSDPEDYLYYYKFSGFFGEPLARLLELEKEGVEFSLGGLYKEKPKKDIINANMSAVEFIKAIKKYVDDAQSFNFDKIAKNHKDVVESYENK